MTDTVYDTTIVAFSNDDLAARQAGNELDARLAYLEEFLRGERVALYNDRLSREYSEHVREIRNDIVDGFIEALDLRGRKAARSTLSRPDYAKSLRAGWPTHDQHLLAAALVGARTVILVTERALSDCTGDIKKFFGFRVIRT